MDPFFETKVKQAFSKVKEDITSIKAEISEIKALIQQSLNQMSLQQKKESLEKSNDFGFSEENQSEDNKGSMGNEGVYSFIHRALTYAHPKTTMHTKTNKMNKKILFKLSLPKIIPPKTHSCLIKTMCPTPYKLSLIRNF